MNKSEIEQMVDENIISINGVIMQISEKCQGLMGKRLEDMDKQELISSIHFIYNKYKNLRIEHSSLLKESNELLLEIKKHIK